MTKHTMAAINANDASQPCPKIGNMKDTTNAIIPPMAS